MRLNKKTLAIATVAVLFVAGGSAAVLQSFGTVSGDANVQQAVTIDGEDATGESGPTIDASYDQEEVAAGSMVKTSHTVQNDADRYLEAGLTTSVTSDSDLGSEGVDTSYVFYDQWNVTEEDGYDVEVNQVEEVTSGDYAIRFTSEDQTTSDYARVWYPVDGLSSGSTTLKYDGYRTENDADRQNPVADEVWVKTANGDEYWLPNGNPETSDEGEYKTVEADLNEGEFVNHDGENPDFSNQEIVAVGIGQGSPDSTDYHVNTTVDNVRLGDENIDEVGDRTLHLNPTGTEDGLTARYGFIQVTDFAINMVPDKYTVSTSINPDESSGDYIAPTED